jgi:hypothetical protein
MGPKAIVDLAQTGLSSRLDFNVVRIQNMTVVYQATVNYVSQVM